jgi:hypothetical protein
MIETLEASYPSLTWSFLKKVGHRKTEMEVSQNAGTPKSSFFLGFSSTTPHFGTPAV